LRIRRRSAAVIAASLAAHALLFTAYLATHPFVQWAEPPAIQVELLRPERPERPKPTPPSVTSNSAPAAAATPAPPILSRPASPSAPALAATPKPLDPRQLTDQELLERAGPRRDLHKYYEEEAKRPLYSRRLPPGPGDCKPADEHSNRIAPPCPVFAGGGLPAFPRLPNRPDVAGEVRTKDAFKAYGDRYGPHGQASSNDFPGMRCKVLHQCGPSDEPDVLNGQPPR
jgi:hypothetical protein